MSGKALSLFLLMLALCLLGLVFVASASSWISLRDTGDSLYLLKKQAMWFVLGLVGFLVMFQVPLAVWQRRAIWTFGIPILLMIALFTPLGVSIGGSVRWISLGPLGSLQPSEFLKLGSVIFFSAWLTATGKRKRTPAMWGALFLFALLPLALIVLEPDLGSTFILGLALLVVFFLANVPLLQLSVGFGTGLIGFLVMAWVFPHGRQRLLTLLNPSQDPTGSGYNIRQSLLSFGAGGIWGVGLGLSRQKFQWLPQAHNDFIFAIVAEETGLPGVLVILALFLFLAWLGYGLAYRSRELFPRLVAAGCTTLLVWQAVTHIGVSTGFLPVTGITLPFISYGGTSLLVSMCICGLLARIAKEEGSKP